MADRQLVRVVETSQIGNQIVPAGTILWHSGELGPNLTPAAAGSVPTGGPKIMKQQPRLVEVLEKSFIADRIRNTGDVVWYRGELSGNLREAPAGAKPIDDIGAPDPAHK